MGAVPLLMLQLDHSDPPGRLGDWLAAAGLDVQVVDLAGGAAVPADLSPYRGVVVLGAGVGVFDDDAAPYLPTVRGLLRGVVRDAIPTLAVCLGAQLLAAANGGRVQPNPEGPELGARLIAKRGAAATDPLFAAMPITPDVIQWHYDAITALPAGAIHLASSPTCENQAFRLGRLAWGIQFHIETTPDVVRAWAAADAPRLPDYELEGVVSRAADVHDDLAEVWVPFAEAFADVVRDPSSVPEIRGAPTTTAGPVTDAASVRAALAAEAHAARPASLPMPGRRPPDE